MNDWIIRVKPTDSKKLNSKYHNLGEKFKALKVSFQKAEGSFIGMAVKFPYYFIFKSIMESEANLFLSDPKAETLSKAWNAPGVRSNNPRHIPCSKPVSTW
jgi:glucose-6-phosphate 1-dehydrogenase